MCGQSGVHAHCLGRGRYIRGIGYACSDCNDVVSLTKDTINTKLHTQELDRMEEHKRRLKELTARDDPVLLASPVFAAPIWRRKFNVEPCKILIEPIEEHLIPENLRQKIEQMERNVQIEEVPSNHSSPEPPEQGTSPNVSSCFHLTPTISATSARGRKIRLRTV